MDGDKSPSERDSEAARRALFESAMFLGQNPFAMSASDPSGAYAQLAAAQMSAYQAMMARHPAFATAPYGGLGMYPEGLASPLHSPMAPFVPGFGLYGNPFLMPPYSSMVTSTTTSTSSNHTSALKQSSAKTTVTSSSTASRSSPAATMSKSSSQGSLSTKHKDNDTDKTSKHETSRTPPTAPPPAHTSVIQSTPKTSNSKNEDSGRDSDDDFLAKEVLNHLKNQQAEFLRREQELKLQHTAESNKSSLSADAQREMAAELIRKRQHEQLVNQLKNSHYDAMPNLKKFAEQQLQKQKNKGKETESKKKKVPTATLR